MLTRESILAMEPGRELDVLVAEKVFDDPVFTDRHGNSGVRAEGGGYYDIPQYSSDITAAWEIVEKLQESHLYTDIRTCADFYEVWITNHASGEQTETFASPKLPEAICKAALLTTISGEDEETNE